MLTVILFSIGAPILAGIGYLIMRDGRPQWSADMRGIALQTVIVIVVLLAIAGAVAGVLITRGEAEVASLQDTTATDPSAYISELTCTNAGLEWRDTAPAIGCHNEELNTEALCTGVNLDWVSPPGICN